MKKKNAQKLPALFLTSTDWMTGYSQPANFYFLIYSSNLWAAYHQRYLHIISITYYNTAE